MKTKYIYLAALAFMTVPAAAQETYQDAKMAENGLTGTARYVGMGGAMEALGADISTIASNPAGIGLLRKSQVSISAGVYAQSNANDYTSFQGNTIGFDAKKGRASFDQIGVVWSPQAKGKNYFNLAFNYHKSADFGQILNAANRLGNASQNKQTAAKYPLVLDNLDRYGQDVADMMWSAPDAAYEKFFGKNEDGTQMNYLNADLFLFGQYQRGYIGEYDFNISGSINNRVWLGLTVGYHDVNYRNNSLYAENLEDGSTMDSYEQVRIDGGGFDIKAGVIFRPSADSPFRIGAYVNTPVFYDLTYKGDYAMVYSPSASYDGTVKENAIQYSGVDYDYRLNTPWKAGVSLGHTIGNNLALGATYEYAWYDHMDNRIKDGGYYDYWYGDYYESSSSDDEMNANTRMSLKGVSTLKLGLEFKPVPYLALRAGYNYVSPMYDRDKGFRDQGDMASPGVSTACSTYFTNWGATNRATLGIGFNYERLNIDLAYQYSTQKGDFYPFMSYVGGSDAAFDNIPPVTEVKYDRHQLMMTVGYRF